MFDVCGNPSPAGEGCNRAGPSNRHEVRVCQPLLYCGKEERLVTTNLESASFDPCVSQAAVQDVDAVAHFECICPLDWFAAIDLKDARFRVSILPRQGIPAIRDRGSGMSVQAPAFRAPRLDGFSGHLGKEQTRANAEDLFSRHGFRFGQPDFMPHPGTCSVSAELPSRQGRSGPYGQHGDLCVYQPAMRFTVSSHVATRLSPPPLESEASSLHAIHIPGVCNQVANKLF